MASNGAIPPPIPEVSADLKFDRGVRVSWTPVKRRIINSLKTQGLVGYTDSTIPKPSTAAPPGTGSTTTSPTPTTPAATAVFLTNPSLEEWVFRNDRAKGIIESHVDDLPSLIADFKKKNAKELFDAFEATYGAKDGMQKVLTMRKLRSCVFTATDSINTFFKRLWDLRKESVEAGNNIDDTTFRDIILAAFPSAAFDTIIQNITSTPSSFPTSATVIQQISFQFSSIENRDNSVVAGDCITQAHAAMMAKIEELEKQVASKSSRDTCGTCGRPGHTKEKCWRKGGGNEGQYPAWWRGKRDPAVASSNLAIGDFPQVYGMTAVSSESRETGEIYADSGASDHFFRDRSDFVTYEPCVRTGQSLEKGTSLNIMQGLRLGGICKGRKQRSEI